MVMPRSRSISMESSTCSLPAISRSDRPPVIWIRRSASVDLPWSIWATMEKLRMLEMGAVVMGGGIASAPYPGNHYGAVFKGVSSLEPDFPPPKKPLRRGHVDRLVFTRRRARRAETFASPSGGLALRARGRSQRQGVARHRLCRGSRGVVDADPDQSQG